MVPRRSHQGPAAPSGTSLHARSTQSRSTKPATTTTPGTVPANRAATTSDGRSATMPPNESGNATCAVPGFPDADGEGAGGAIVPDADGEAGGARSASGGAGFGPAIPTPTTATSRTNGVASAIARSPRRNGDREWTDMGSTIMACPSLRSDELAGCAGAMPRRRDRATLPAMTPTPELADLEQRSYWQATMPPLPDRSGRDLP